MLWLLLFVVLQLGDKLARSREKLAQQGRVSPEEQPPDYRGLKCFALCKWFSATAYSVLIAGANPFHLATRTIQLTYAGISWAIYILSALCVISVIGSILKKGLSPLPGLSTAAWAIFRWAAALAFVIALTAHLPLFGVRNLNRWLDEVSFSFLLCICMFELSILALFLTQLRRLGMFLMSRPIGLALGLAVIGLSDLAVGITVNAPPRVLLLTNLGQEVAIAFVVAMWSFYILRREPKRLKHSLSPASRLSKWDDIAKRIGVAHKETEHVPFITTVEAVVDGILERHKEKAS